MSRHRPILYSFRRCPYAMRARLAIFQAGITCEIREVVLRQKPEELLKISPKGTVPVLQLADGEIIEESLEIMLWALAQNDRENWLPALENMKKNTRILIEKNDRDFKFHLDRYKYPNRFKEEEGTDGSPPDFHRQEALKILENLEGHLVKQGALVGPDLTLADYAILPFIRQFAATDRQWFDTHAPRNLKQWLDDFLASRLLENIMKKYQPWQQGQTPVYNKTS